VVFTANQSPWCGAPNQAKVERYRYDTKFYALVTHSIIRKFGEFHYIIDRIDKITQLLEVAT